MFTTFIHQTRTAIASVFIVATLLVIGAVAAPQAKAATAEELQAQIAALMAQIAAMQNGSNVSPVTPISINRFIVGESIRTAATVNVRDSASLTGVSLGKQTAGQLGVVTAGPIRKDGHVWWKIDYLSGPDGWTAEFWLVSNATDGATSIQKGFHRLSKGVDTEVAPGKVGARIVAIEIPAANVDRYVNSVTIFATAGERNENKAPWSSFNSFSLVTSGVNIGSRVVTSSEKWTAVSGQKDTYAINLFTGNVKIPAGRSYNADLVLNVGASAHSRDTWSFGVPKEGIVVWSNLTGHRKYGSSTNDMITIKVNGVATSSDKGEYFGYIDGREFIHTQQITKAEAEKNCKANAAANPGKEVHCIWNGKQIYPAEATASSTSYTLADVKSITKKVVDPIPTAVDDEYTLYRIVLNNGKVHEVKVGFMPISYRDEQFRKTGYTGDIAKLIAMATIVTPTPALGTYIIYYSDGTKVTHGDTSKEMALQICTLEAVTKAPVTIRCTWNGEEIFKNGTVTAKINNFTVTPTLVKSGQSVTFSWSATGVTDCNINRSLESLIIPVYKNMGTGGTKSHLPTWDTGESKRVFLLRCQDASSVAESYVTASAEVNKIFAPVGSTTTVIINSITNSKNPTVSGQASGVNNLGLSIDNGDKVYGSGPISIVNGFWSHKVTTDLKNGKYTFTFYADGKEIAKRQFEVSVVTSTSSAPIKAGAVLGASTNVYDELSATLQKLSTLLLMLK